jgi:hypothetical protein
MRNTPAKIGGVVVNLLGITAVDGDPLHSPARMSIEFPVPADAYAFVTGKLARYAAATVDIRRIVGVMTAFRFDRGRLVRHAMSVGDPITVDQLAALAAG